MPDASSLFVIRRFPNLLTTEWRPITVAIECSAIVIENLDAANAVTICTDQNDGNTAKSLPASNELDIRSAVDGPFPAGKTICYAQATVAGSTLCVSYTR